MTKLIPIDNKNLKGILIYDPIANTKTPAILDIVSGLVIGMTDCDRPYYPAGGSSAIESIIDTGGFVEGSVLKGYPCWNCHDDVYRLGEMPQSTFETALSKA